MRSRRLSCLLACVAATAVAFALARIASAGPPLICHPIAIGVDDPTLPWGDGPFEEDDRYDRDRVVSDTLARLAPDTLVLARMETLRRASLYLRKDAERSVELLARLMARALDAEAAGTPDGLAWLDAGYLAQIYEQFGHRHVRDWNCGTAAGISGYAWVKRAITLRGDDPSLEFAAALMTAMAEGDACETHWRNAKQGAAQNPLLATNLKRHAGTVEEVRRHVSRKKK